MNQVPGPSPRNHEIRRFADRDQVAKSREYYGRTYNIYKEILAEASTKDLSQAEVKEFLVDGWNAGAITRVVLGERYRGSGYTLNILHGKIPKDLFDHFQEDEDFGVVMPNEEYPEGMVKLIWPDETVATKPNPAKPSEFYVEKVQLPQGEGHHQYPADEVAARLEKVRDLLEQ